MPDERVICIGGEHEDHHDPDFCIYNDVIVLRRAAGKDEVDLESGEVEIYGYPEAVFAPTDFHSATLVGDRIYVIGRLGYGTTRVEGVTPIVCLNTSTYEIEQVMASGPAPGLIYKHQAVFDEVRGAITVRGGKICVNGAEADAPHAGVHRLHLDGMRWEFTAVGNMYRRFLIENDAFGVDSYEGITSDTFRPENVSHRRLAPDRWQRIYELDVQGTPVTFECSCGRVQVVIEGRLPADVVNQTVIDVLANLERDTKKRWSFSEVKSLPPD